MDLSCHVYCLHIQESGRRSCEGEAVYHDVAYGLAATIQGLPSHFCREEVVLLQLTTIYLHNPVCPSPAGFCVLYYENQYLSNILYRHFGDLHPLYAAFTLCSRGSGSCFDGLRTGLSKIKNWIWSAMRPWFSN